MKKIYLSQPKVFNYWRGGFIGAICLLYILGHVYFPEYPPDIAGCVFVLATLVVCNQFLKFRDSSYLVFGQENLTFGSAHVTLWHIPLTKISHASKERAMGTGNKNTPYVEQVFFYTTEGDKYSLPQGLVVEEKFAEITAEIARVKIELELDAQTAEREPNKLS